MIGQNLKWPRGGLNVTRKKNRPKLPKLHGIKLKYIYLQGLIYKLVSFWFRYGARIGDVNYQIKFSQKQVVETI